MDADQWSGVVAGGLIVVAHLLVQQVVVAAAHGVLGPNRFVGIRTDDTLASREAWQAAHRAVLALVGVVTVVGLVLAVAARRGSQAAQDQASRN